MTFQTNILAILIFVFGMINAQEDSLHWETDINQAIVQSVENDKKVLIFFTGSDWCGWCIKLQNEVFKKEAFKAWAKDYVLVELDFPRRKKIGC